MMRWLALVAGMFGALLVLRWLILRALPWDPEWMNDDAPPPLAADPYLLGLVSHGRTYTQTIAGTPLREVEPWAES